MYGAILGDIIGAPYEFYPRIKTKQFPLFSSNKSMDGHFCFTDDSVMTVAVADALLNLESSDMEDVKYQLTNCMQSWGKTYPNAGYGGNFYNWLFDDNPHPYGSYGNGSAMRVSPVGWLYDDLYQTRLMARLTAEVSHNHLEGLRGAESVASAIFLARVGVSKQEISDYIVHEFGYDLSFTCDELRPKYRFDVSCQGTVPAAIVAFIEGNDFEDCVRNAVSLGGDADTLGCITGSIAEAFYGVPQDLVNECRVRVTHEMLDVINAFYSRIKSDKTPI